MHPLNNPILTKTFMPHDCSGLVEAFGGHLCTLFERGSIKTSASDLFSRRELQDFAPPSGHFMMHQIVMGSEELYGPNNNFDSWPDACLREYHPTFVTHGRVYREHRNSSPDLSIGVIKAARYSSKMGRVETIRHVNIARAEKEYEMAKAGKELHSSMAARVPYDVCLARGTLVTTQKGQVPIEMVRKGDKVLTHLGRWRKVTRLYRTPGRVHALKFNVGGTDVTLTGTDNHPLFVLSGSKATKNQVKFRRRKVNKAGDVTSVAGYDSAPDFVAAADVTTRDYLLTPIPPPGTRSPTIDPWMAGLALADGSVFGRRRGRNRRGTWCEAGVQFSLGADKFEIIEELHATAKRNGLACQVYPCKSKNAFTVVVHGVDFAKEFAHLFGRAADKHVAPEVLEWNPSALRCLIAGWLDGDGSQDPERGTARGCSVLPAIAQGMWDVALRSGIGLTRNKQPTTGDWASSPHAHILFFNKKSTEMLVEVSTRLKKSDAPSIKGGVGFFYVHNQTRYYAQPVVKVESTELTETFNIAVDEDESYVAEGFAVHNCSICKNQAKYSSLYCADLRDRMGQWHEAQKKYAYAINPIATFFDDSFVANPAARMAKHIEVRFNDADLMKAASARPVFGGAQWAEFSNAAPKAYLNLSNDEASTLRKLARLEGSPRDVYRNAVTSLAFDPSEKFDEWTSKVAGLMPGTTFQKLAERATFLPFDQFCSYVTDKPVQVVRDNVEFRKAASTLSSVFRALADVLDNGGECCCGGDDINMFRPAGAFARYDPGDGDAIDRIMDRASDHWSAGIEPVRRRSVRVILIKTAGTQADVAPQLKASDLSPLAVMYGLYKVAACSSILAGTPSIPEHHLLSCCVDQHCAENLL